MLTTSLHGFKNRLDKFMEVTVLAIWIPATVQTQAELLEAKSPFYL